MSTPTPAYTPIALLLIHGIGSQAATFADASIDELTRRFTRALSRLPDPPPDPTGQLICRPVHWSPILFGPQRRLWSRITADHDLDFIRLRRYLIEFAGDAIAYQITPHDRVVYDAIHQRITAILTTLQRDPNITATTPLAILGHSLGTVIASNWIWDIQHTTHDHETDTSTPLTRGETLTHLFTLGSPLALWSLRFTHPPFGLPVTIPSPHLAAHYPEQDYPNLTGQWLNFYDEDDVIATPLKPLNAAYDRMVARDIATNVGGLFSSWNPLSHNAYWTDDDVTVPIVRSLVQLWTEINQHAPVAP